MKILWLSLALVTLAQYVNGADPSASCVSVIRKDGGGSGTVVYSDTGRSLVLTCQHVCHDAAQVWVVAVVDGKHKKVPAQWLGAVKADGYDLAILSVDVTLPAVQIGTKEVVIGDTVRHFGKASGPQEGKVSGHKEWSRDRTISVQAEMLCVPCDSGAGLFNARGELVGVVDGVENRSDDSDNSLACQSSAMRDFVARFIPKTIPRKR